MIEQDITGTVEHLDFRHSKLAMYAPDVAIDGFAPGFRCGSKETADAGRIDSTIQCSGIEGDHAALAMAGHADFQFGIVLGKPIDSG